MDFLISRLREALSASNRSDHSPKVTSASPASRNVSNDQDSSSSRASPSRELQALREKLNLSEKLNTALKYELEANKSLATKSASRSDEPLMGHLEELRQLRSRLEESIKTYDQLCIQLEEKLKELSQGEGREEILKESVSLVKENESLRRKAAQFNEEVKLIQQQLEEHRLTRKRLVIEIFLVSVIFPFFAVHFFQRNKREMNESCRNALNFSHGRMYMGVWGAGNAHPKNSQTPTPLPPSHLHCSLTLRERTFPASRIKRKVTLFELVKAKNKNSFSTENNTKTLRKRISMDVALI